MTINAANSPVPLGISCSDSNPLTFAQNTNKKPQKKLCAMCVWFPHENDG